MDKNESIDVVKALNLLYYTLYGKDQDYRVINQVYLNFFFRANF